MFFGRQIACSYCNVIGQMIKEYDNAEIGNVMTNFTNARCNSVSGDRDCIIATRLKKLSVHVADDLLVYHVLNSLPIELSN